jgi:predicted dehydrogenase
MVKLAIIGLGAVTNHMHLPAYARLKDCVQVVGGCDVSAERRVAMARKWALSQVFDNPEEMLEKTRPDIVAICTPPALHCAQTLLALGFGCHVFCEKPLAESLSQADAMIATAERAARLIVVNNQYPCMNIHRTAKETIGAPEFGRLLFLHAWQTFRPTEATERGWRGQMERRLGFEFGIHVFDLARYFFDDEPTRVYAVMPQPIPGVHTDVVNIVSLEFADGRAASIVLDRLSKGPERYLNMRLDGEFAAIQTSIGGQVRFELGLHTKERKPFAGFHFVKGGRALLQNGTDSRVLAKDDINPFAGATAVHLRNFVRALGHGELPRGHAAENRHSLAIVFAAYDSAATGQPVEMRLYTPARLASC